MRGDILISTGQMVDHTLFEEKGLWTAIGFNPNKPPVLTLLSRSLPRVAEFPYFSDARHRNARSSDDATRTVL
jgi:hypothetical protein